MKLYTFDIAPNARRLGLFMSYKGIEIDTQQVDLGKLEQHEDWFAELNPLRTIPALQLDDGTLLTEVVAQAAYLETLYPEKPLMGGSDVEKALVLQWDHLIMMHGLGAIADMFRNKVKGFQGRATTGAAKVEQIPELVTRGKQLLDGFWDIAERQLEGRDWITGDNFTFADIDLLCAVEFAGWVKESLPQDRSRLQDWHKRASAVVS